MVATLTRIFGLSILAGEDVVQATLAERCRPGPSYGVRKIRPVGLCRGVTQCGAGCGPARKSFRDKEGEIARLIEGGPTASDEMIFDELAIKKMIGLR